VSGIVCIRLIAWAGDASAIEASQKESANECLNRAEVKAYLQQITPLILEKWVTPAEVPAGQKVLLQFSLNPDGLVLSAESLGSNDPKLAASGVKAIRAAAPFPSMSKRVSCLAGLKIKGLLQPTSNVSGSQNEGQVP
jgi:membrane protein involved in colicin uptake